MGWAERLYGRWGAAYTDLLVAVSLLGILLFTALHPLEAIAFLEADSSDYVRIEVAGLTSMVVAAVIWLPLVRRALRPIREFSAEPSHERALAAWDVVVSGVPHALSRVALIVELFALPPTVYAVERVSLSAAWVPAVFVALTVLIIGGFVIVYLAWEAALAPVVRAINEVAPQRRAEAPAWTRIGFRLLAVPLVASAYTAILAQGLSSDQLSPGARVLVGLGSVLIVGLTLSLGMTLLLRRSILEPTEDLIGATARVRAGDLSQPVPLSTGDELGTLTQSFNRMMDGLREREALQAALEAYVHPEIVDRLIAEGTILEGRELEVTVVFIDVRDFTAYAESVTPRRAVEFLNRFFALAVPIIEASGGHANKFVGDGLLAAFGAPTPIAGHAERAVRAAADLADAVDREFEGSLRVGIGINSGSVLMGTVGGGRHLEFTLIGDAVNIAARVEQLTKETGDSVLITDATRRALDEPAPMLERRGEVRLKGKTGSIEVFGLPALRAPAARGDRSGQAAGGRRLR